MGVNFKISLIYKYEKMFLIRFEWGFMWNVLLTHARTPIIAQTNGDSVRRALIG